MAPVRIYRFAFFGLFAVACAYIAFKNVQIAGNAGYDFKSFWLAGYVWADGASAYGSIYHETGKQIIPGDFVPKNWYYPPNLFPVTLLQSLLPLVEADIFWRLVNSAMMVLASVLLFAALPEDFRRKMPFQAVFPNHPARAGFLLYFFWFAVFQATGLCLVLGQLAFLLYAGFVLLLAGIAREKVWWQVLGLSILCLKPQIGACMVLALMLHHRGAWPVIWRTVVVSTVMAMPTLISDPLSPLTWLQNVTGPHGEHPANVVGSITGLRNILWATTGLEISNMTAQVLTLIFVALLGSLLRTRTGQLSLYEALLLQMLLICAVAPLHFYDFVVLGPVALLVLNMPKRPLVVCALAFLALLRPNDVAAYFNLIPDNTGIFIGSWMATYAVLVLFLVATYAALTRPATATSGKVPPDTL